MPVPEPVPWPRALIMLAQCALDVARSLWQRRLHQPLGDLGRVISFADGTEAVVYRETVRDDDPITEPVNLIVGFRLRAVGGNSLAHRFFRVESVCNTVLFAGFDGFVSKLWMTADGNNVYRGVYEWDGYDSSVDYVNVLWWPLMAVSERDSIRYHVIDDSTRGSLLSGVHTEAGGREWWRPTV